MSSICRKNRYCCGPSNTIERIAPKTHLLEGQIYSWKELGIANPDKEETK